MDDARLPVVVGEAARARQGDRVLAAPVALPDHVAGCACCRPRNGLAAALAAVFLEQARAAGAPPIRRVLVTGAAPAAVAAAIEGDVLARARFRFDGEAG